MTSLVEKFANPAPSGAPVTPAPANRNRRACVMLHIIDSDGTQWGEPYAYLLEIKMQRDRQTIHLRFTHRRVVIKGVRLQPVFEGLLDHSWAYVEVATSPFIDDQAEEPHIQSVEVQELEPEAKEGA